MFGSLSVSGIIRREYKEVVHVDDKPSFHNHIFKQVIHETLEGGRGVDEIKGHDSRFTEALVGNKGSFSLVSILDMDIVISLSYIEFGEDFGIP